MQVQLLQEPLYSSGSRGVKSCRLDRSTDVREVKRLGKGILKSYATPIPVYHNFGFNPVRTALPLGDKSLDIRVKNAPPIREYGFKNCVTHPSNLTHVWDPREPT